MDNLPKSGRKHESGHAKRKARAEKEKAAISNTRKLSHFFGVPQAETETTKQLPSTSESQPSAREPLPSASEPQPSASEPQPSASSSAERTVGEITPDRRVRPEYT